MCCFAASYSYFCYTQAMTALVDTIYITCFPAWGNSLSIFAEYISTKYFSLNWQNLPPCQLTPCPLFKPYSLIEGFSWLDLLQWIYCTRAQSTYNFISAHIKYLQPLKWCTANQSLTQTLRRSSPYICRPLFMENAESIPGPCREPRVSCSYLLLWWLCLMAHYRFAF